MVGRSCLYLQKEEKKHRLEFAPRPPTGDREANARCGPSPPETREPSGSAYMPAAWMEITRTAVEFSGPSLQRSPAGP